MFQARINNLYQKEIEYPISYWTGVKLFFKHYRDVMFHEIEKNKNPGSYDYEIILFYNTYGYLGSFDPVQLVTSEYYYLDTLDQVNHEIEKIKNDKKRISARERLFEQEFIRTEILKLLREFSKKYGSRTNEIESNKLSSEQVNEITIFCHKTLDIISSQDLELLKHFLSNPDLESEKKIKLQKPNQVMAHLFSALDFSEGREYKSNANYHIKAGRNTTFISNNYKSKAMDTRKWCDARDEAKNSSRSEIKLIDDFLEKLLG